MERNLLAFQLFIKTATWRCAGLKKKKEKKKLLKRVPICQVVGESGSRGERQSVRTGTQFSKPLKHRFQSFWEKSASGED